MKNEVCKIHIPDELVASVNNNGSLVTIEERNPVFQDGDIVWIQTRYDGNVISIFSNWDNKDIITHFNLFLHSNNFYCCKEFLNESITKIRLASESEKAKLFDRIKREGYQWNVNTKTLEEKYSPKRGDIVYIKDISGEEWISIFDKIENDKLFTYCDKSSYLYTNHYCLMYMSQVEELRLATENEKNLLFNALSEESFVWDSENKVLNKKFKLEDGDIITDEDGNIIIFNRLDNLKLKYYCALFVNDNYLSINDNVETSLSYFGFIPDFRFRLSTEEEKQHLFDMLKLKKSLIWNSNTKSLDKLYLPQDGDIIYVDKGSYRDTSIAIFSHKYDCFMGSYYKGYCCIDADTNKFYNHNYVNFNIERPIRLATEEEKRRLFNAIKENKLSWNSETKELEPLVELIEPNQGDYVFIKTKFYSYVAIFDNKELNKINTFCYKNITENYLYNRDSFFNISNILEMRLATNSEIEEFNKQSISQGLMWNPYLKKFLSIPKHGDLCIFYDEDCECDPRLSIFVGFENNLPKCEFIYDYCIPYDERIYKQMIDFK